MGILLQLEDEEELEEVWRALEARGWRRSGDLLYKDGEGYHWLAEAKGLEVLLHCGLDEYSPEVLRRCVKALQEEASAVAEALGKPVEVESLELMLMG